MSRPTRWLAAALWVLGACAAGAQEAPADLPAGPATLRGRIVHAERPAAAAGVPVILYALADTGEPGLRSTTSDGEGRFVFEGISNDPGTVYLLGARFGGIPFGKRVAFAAGERERSETIEVSDPTPDVSGLESGEIELRLDLGCSALQVRQTHYVENAAGRVVFVPEASRDVAAPALALQLPPGASEIEPALGAFAEEFERDGDTLRFWGPLYPGPQEVSFVYGLTLPAGGASRLPLRLVLPAGSPGARVLVRPGGPRVLGRGLEESGTSRIEGVDYTQLVAGAVAAGGELALEIGLEGPSGPRDGVEISHSLLWLELDDAALSVNEQHRIEVTEDAHGTAGDGPLLCLGLPRGAEGLRFAPEALSLGLEPEPSGTLAIRGPLPPGPSLLALRYRMAPDREPFVFERSFDVPVELLSVLVADTGILPETSRLHRRRPVRSADRNYLHLEGFAIDADETLELSLERVPAPRPLPRSAAAAFAVVVATGALVVLLGPLRGGAEPDEAEESAAALERASVYGALRDLEEDFETGKLDAADHERMRAELRARAVALMRAERAERAEAEVDGEPRDRVGQTPDAACPDCGSAPRPGDRFCSRCGARLQDEDPGSAVG